MNKIFINKDGRRYKFNRWITKKEKELYETHKNSKEYLFTYSGKGYKLYLYLKNI